jgi:hypothetical protein
MSADADWLIATKLAGIQSRIDQRKRNRVERGESNRQSAPEVAAFLDLIRTRFPSASVGGFSEGGVTKGDPDIFAKATPIGWGWELGKEPKGPGISRGKSRSTAANPTGEK